MWQVVAALRGVQRREQRKANVVGGIATLQPRNVILGLGMGERQSRQKRDEGAGYYPHQPVWPAWMLIKIVGHIVNHIINHQPAVLFVVVGGDLFESELLISSKR